MIAKLLSILLFMSVMLVSCAGTDSNSDGTDANDNMLSTTDVPRIIEDSEHHSPDDRFCAAGYDREERYDDDYGKKQSSDAHSLSPLNHIFFKRLWQI